MIYSGYWGVNCDPLDTFLGPSREVMARDEYHQGELILVFLDTGLLEFTLRLVCVSTGPQECLFISWVRGNPAEMFFYLYLRSGVFPWVTLVPCSLGVRVIHVADADRVSRYCFSRGSGNPLG